MLKETETEETIDFFATFLSLITLRLGRDPRTSRALATPMARGPRAPQFKFNNLFNERFPMLFFSKVLCCVKTGEVEVNGF